VVFYMAVRHVGKIAARLADSGLSPDTPTAVVEHATTPRERVVVAPLARIGEEAADVEGPAVLVVGEPVRLRSKLAECGIRSAECGIGTTDPWLLSDLLHSALRTPHSEFGEP
jgi:hypothetical protein